MTLRIGAIDDHSIVLQGLAATLQAHLDAVVAPVAPNLTAFLAADPAVDIVLLDLELRDGSDPADNVAALVERGHPVLIFTQDQRLPLLARALRAGASGVLSKGEDLPVILEAIRCVLSGHPYLSSTWAEALMSDTTATPTLAPRELQIVRMYAGGLPISEIASRLFVTEDTVSTNLSRVRAKYAKIGRPAHDRADLFKRVVADGLLPGPSV